jgi:hypothetical protein
VLMNVLVSRHRNLQVVKALWSAGNVKVSCSFSVCSCQHNLTEWLQLIEC